MEFMRDNGKFEEFIDAKLLGKDVEAKWMLLDNAESDINKIMAKKVEPKKPMNVKPPKEAQEKAYVLNEENRFIMFRGKSRNSRRHTQIQSPQPYNKVCKTENPPVRDNEMS